MKPSGYIVVYDDNECVCAPMTWDECCAGALETGAGCAVAIFPTKDAARKAIRISTAYARLRLAQGLPANSDFTEAISAVKIVPCVLAQGEMQP